MKYSAILILGLFAFIALTASKCNKETPPKATVTVIDQEGHSISGASVKVYSDPTYYNNGQGYQNVGFYNPDEKTLTDVQISDGAGQTHHSFKYESIYSVKVTYIKSITGHGQNADTVFWYGDGALILKVNKDYPETITIYPGS